MHGSARPANGDTGFGGNPANAFCKGARTRSTVTRSGSGNEHFTASSAALSSSVSWSASCGLRVEGHVTRQQDCLRFAGRRAA